MPNETQKTKDDSPQPSRGPGGTSTQSSDTIPDRSIANRRPMSDTVPEQAGVYVPPRPLASPADHRTIEIKPVRLADEIDPRRALTELKLTAPPLRPNRLPWVVAAGLIALVAGVLYAARDGRSQAAPAVTAPPAAVPASTAVTSPPVSVPPSQPALQPEAAKPSTVAPVTKPQAAERPTAPDPLAPVTPADLDREARSAGAAPKAVESSRKKAREPWLE